MARENNRAPRRTEDDGMIKKLVCVNRVTKVVKGGKNMRFAALVVVGDGKGSIGYAIGKSTEVPEAIEKATQKAKRNMVKVSLLGTSIPHETIGKFNRGSILMLPAAEGTGVIAGGPVRAVLEMAGIKDIRTKSIGTTTPINCVRATINGLRQLRTAEEIMEVRNIGKADDEKIVL